MITSVFPETASQTSYNDVPICTVRLLELPLTFIGTKGLPIDAPLGVVFPVRSTFN